MSDDEALTHRVNELTDRCEWGIAALELFQQLAKRAPTSAANWIGMARCYEALGQLDKAAGLYAAVLKRSPGEAVADNRHLELNRRVAARHHALKLQQEHGSDVLRTKLDVADEPRFRNPVFRAEAFRVLVADAPDDLKTLSELGGALRDAGDPAGAIQVYRHAVDLDPSPSSNAPAHVGLAAVLRDLKRLDDAAETYNLVLRARPGDNYAKIGLAAVHLDRYEQHRSGTAHLDAAERLLRSAWRPEHQTGRSRSSIEASTRSGGERRTDREDSDRVEVDKLLVNAIRNPRPHAAPHPLFGLADGSLLDFASIG